MINCIIDMNRPLPTNISNAVYRATVAMLRKNRSSATIKNDEFVGKISTDGSRQTLGTFSGIACKAHIESAQGDTKITFLITNSDLPDADLDWTYHRSVKDLDRFGAELERAHLPPHKIN